MGLREAPFVLHEQVALRPLTTLGVGGPARWFARAESATDVAAIHHWCSERSLPFFVLGGGSNVVVSDEGYPGLVLLMAVTGLTITERGGEAIVTCGAGEAWDRVVEAATGRGLSGIECLSGIPGTVGGTPIQNVGAYGQEVAGAIECVRAFDRSRSEQAELASSDCHFSYRTSRFKADDAGRFVVCGVSFRLTRSALTLTYPELVSELARRGVSSPDPASIREVVLAIRRRKGMVLDASDSDTRSVGSFFMNPVVARDEVERVAALAGQRVPGFAAAPGHVKIPAAWLIERSGLQKGSGGSTVGLSTKHPLAIVNRGGANARDVLRFAVQVKRAVLDWCGISLRPEPVFVGLDGDDDVEFLRKACG